MTGRPDVAVVGGGVIGCAAALRLAQDGLAVVVLERDTPGGGASWAAGGMLSPISEAAGEGPFRTLALASFERYPAFVAEVEALSGLPVGYRTDGKLEVALSDADAESLRARYAGIGAPAGEWLDRAAALSCEPGLAASIRGALLFRRDHSIDNRMLGRALWLAARHAGVTFHAGGDVARLRHSRGRVHGVALRDGTMLDAPTVVIAAGAWSAQIDELPRPLAVAPVRGQMAALDAAPDTIRHTLMTTRCYLIPRRDGRVLVGATVERAGFRIQITAAGIQSLLNGALEVLPALGDAALAEVWAGLRPGSPDDLPIIGADPDVAGLVYATGHYRNGILLTPITAELVRDLVVGRRPAELAPFSPARFRIDPATP
ncbi:MAG: glycine oxidase ThiO [Longimicrobiales bacterium]